MGLMTSLFGKSVPATSNNKFADQLNQQFSPMANYGAQGMGQYANILGLGGGEAQSGAMDNYYNSSGGKFLMNQGMDQIMGNRAAGGLLRSGGTSKAIEDYRSGLASTKMGDYMGLLGNLNQQALGAGNLIANAGSQSTSATKTGGGLGKALGLGLNVASSIAGPGGLGKVVLGGLKKLFSDVRLKTNIEKVGEYPDGLGMYEWDYLPTEGRIAAFLPEGRQRGVMAHEVAVLRPDALGPVIDGYATVDYSMLEAA